MSEHSSVFFIYLLVEHILRCIEILRTRIRTCVHRTYEHLSGNAIHSPHTLKRTHTHTYTHIRVACITPTPN